MNSEDVRQRVDELGSRLGDLSGNVDLGPDHIKKQQENLEMDIFVSEVILLEALEFLDEMKRKVYDS